MQVLHAISSSARHIPLPTLAGSVVQMDIPVPMRPLDDIESLRQDEAAEKSLIGKHPAGSEQCPVEGWEEFRADVIGPEPIARK